MAENGTDGINSGASGGVYFTVEESSIVDNLHDGIDAAFSSEKLEVGGSTIGGNRTGVVAGGGASIFTFGNNQMSANGANGSFTPGGPGPQ